MRQGWEMVRLRDVVSSISHTYKFVDEEVIFLNTSDVELGKIINRPRFHPKDLPGQAKKRIQKGDILFSEIRPSNGRWALVNEECDDYVVSTKLMVLRTHSKLHNRFFFQYLTYGETTEYLQMIAESRSGTFPQITYEEIADLEIPLPPLAEQEAIAEVLSSLDDKIDLLHRQNQTLEAMAQCLFNQWCQEGEGETTLADHVVIMRGLSYKGSGLTDGESGLPMYNLNSVKEGGGYKQNGLKFYDGPYRESHTASPGDVIIANTEQGHKFLLIGYPAVVPMYAEPGIISQHIYKLALRAESPLSNWSLYHLLMTDHVREQVVGATNGSTVNMLSAAGLAKVTFSLPDSSTLKSRNAELLALHSKREKNEVQIRTLTQTRDLLLPRLLSGEVVVRS